MIIIFTIGLLLITFFTMRFNPKDSKVKSIWKSTRFSILILLTSLMVANILGLNILPEIFTWNFWLIGSKKLMVLFTLFSFLLILLLFFLCIKRVTGYLAKRKLKFIDILTYSVSLIFVFLGALILFSSYWGMNHFGDLSIDQIVYHLTEPLTGSDNSQIYAYIQGAFLKALVTTSFASEILLFLLSASFSKQKYRQQFRHKTLRRFTIMFTGLLALALGTTFGLQRIGFAQINAYFFQSSSIYESEYRNPSEVKVTFPKKKRNLIYIFLESMESSYFSTEFGGSQKENLLPNMANLAETIGINFSNTDAFGGAQQVSGVGFTAGGMVAQTAGVPLITTVNGNDYGNTSDYLPGAYSIGQILASEGYNQTLLLGSEASFGGRDKYFTQHGNYNIVDYNTAIKNGWIDKDYSVWWGYEDNKLFNYAKETLNDLASQEEPFNLTFLTADTHFEDGYMSDETPVIFDDQYSNVIHYSDEMLYEFLTWVMEQPFYENTTIVISGDHLTMDKNFFENLDPNYTRTVFNLILNSAVQPNKNKNRQFSTLDMYPTTLAAMGVSIDGNRLGLGTNLFSKEKTLMEKYGVPTFKSELAKGSEYYQEVIMQGSEDELLPNETVTTTESAN